MRRSEMIRLMAEAMSGGDNVWTSDKGSFNALFVYECMAEAALEAAERAGMLPPKIIQSGDGWTNHVREWEPEE